MAEPLRVGTPLKVALVATLAWCMLAGLWFVTGALSPGPDRPEIFDFHMFYLAGQMVWSGRYAEAYAPATMRLLEAALGHGRDVFLPWIYPPVFGFVVAPLAALPPGPAYLAFATATLALFWATMKRLGGSQFWPVILATAPAMLINLRSGQNGLLTGGLFGLAAIFLLGRRAARAGAAMGCLALKPHLALVLPLMLVAQRRWSTLTVAGLTGLGLTLLSVAVFGPAAFLAFLRATADAGHYLAMGAVPLHRMTSVYAFALSLGAPTKIAAVLHGAVAVGILAGTAWIFQTTRDPRVQIGMAATACAFISPYFFDYDQTTFAVGAMLLAPTLSRAMIARQFGLLLFCIAVGQALGIAIGALGIEISLGGPVLLAAYLVMLRVVHLDSLRAEETGLQRAALGGVA